MSDPSTTPRPYTSYNLFFQLEREYILQTLHGHRPSIAPEDVFDPASDTYPSDGPPLPSRYAALSLPWDWHVPGKTRRRKRVHRKSHGKIGFHELNERISGAWQAAEDEVKDFCARLSEIESAKYKRAKTREKRVARKGRRGGKTKATASDPMDDDWSDPFPSFDWAANLSNVPEDYVDSPFQPSKIMSRMISRETVDMELDEITESTASLRDSLTSLTDSLTSLRDSFTMTLTEVDMEDDEIMDLWEATRVDKNEVHPMDEIIDSWKAAQHADIKKEHAIESILSLSRVCVEIPATCNNKGAVSQIEAEGGGGGGGRRDGARESFIDAEYEKFLKIGQQFSTTKQRLPSDPKKNAFAACQA